jgi:hypothetical protein
VKVWVIESQVWQGSKEPVPQVTGIYRNLTIAMNAMMDMNVPTIIGEHKQGEMTYYVEEFGENGRLIKTDENPVYFLYPLEVKDH